MPTLTHAIITACIGALFYLITREQSKQFKAEHLIVFALNGFVGPDLSKFFSPFFGSGYWSNPTFLALNTFVHSLIGWIIISPILALVYFLIFKLTQEAKSTGKSPISYIHLVILIIAAGMNHLGIDMLDGYVRVFPAIFGVYSTIGIVTFQNGVLLAEGPLWESMSWFGNKYLLLIGLTFMVLLIWQLKNKSLKIVIFTTLVFILVTYGLILLIGTNIVNNENDMGYAAYIAITWLFPLYACYFCRDDKPEKINK